MPEVVLNSLVQNEISRIAEAHGVDSHVLKDFALFVIKNHKVKPAKIKPLTLAELKTAVYKYFGVKDTTQLKRSNSFKMATDGIAGLNLGRKESWETLYREFIGVLPHEQNQKGYGCINGINIFKYFRPWQVFGLNPETATQDDIKKAYWDLSKVYHPDSGKTADADIFGRLNSMYKSIAAEA